MKINLSHYIFGVLNDLSYKYKFFSDLKSFFHSAKSFFSGKKDIVWVINEIKKARGEDNPVKIIFDIGAATGDKTIVFLKNFPETVVYAFEPQRESLEKFKKRTKFFKDRIKIFDFGFLNSNTTVFLNITPHRDASSILPPENCPEIKKETIKVFRIDDFMDQQKISHIDFMKIDVEGVEKEILEGGPDTFKNKVDNIFIEILPSRRGPNSSHVSDTFKFFADNGFTFMGKYGDYFFSKDANILKKCL